MTNTMKIKFLALAAVLAVTLFTGCQTKTGTLVSVIITNQPMPAITQAVNAVFVSHGYSGGRIGPGQFAYHRTGTRSDNVAYNNYTFDEIVTIRVVVVINKIDAGSMLVGCDAWLVEGADDPVFGDSHQIRKLRKWPYQQLLRDIRTQLGQ
jgi:hypothetical protein